LLFIRYLSIKELKIMAETNNMQGRNRQVGTNWASDYQAASVWVSDGPNGSKIIHFVGFDTNALKNVLKAISDKGNTPSKRNAKPNMGFEFCAWKGQGDKLDFQIVTSSEEGVQQFLDSGWITMQNALIEAGVDPKKVDPLTDEIEMAMNAMTPEQQQEMIQVANQSFAELWQEYLNKMNDPETQEMLKLFGQVYGDTRYGWVLSIRNVIMAKAQKPDATHVLSRIEWRIMGRGVRPGAQPIFLFRPASIFDFGEEDIAEALRQWGHKSDSFADQGATVRNGVRVQADYNTRDRNFRAIWYTAYDISDTYRFDEDAEDTLITKPGITSNLAYALNDKAIELENEKRTGNKDDNDALGDKRNDVNERTQIAYDVVVSLCKDKGIAINDNPNASLSGKLVDALLAYYRPLIKPKANIIKAENITRYAMDATQLTLLMTNTGLDQLNRFAHTVDYTDKEGAALGNVISPVVTKINRRIADIQHNNVIKNDEMEQMWMQRLGGNTWDKSDFASKKAQQDDMWAQAEAEKASKQAEVDPEVARADKEAMVKRVMTTPQGKKEVGANVGGLRGMDKKMKKKPVQTPQPDAEPQMECKHLKEEFYRVFNKINQQLF
jgi:hypothetical protein